MKKYLLLIKKNYLFFSYKEDLERDVEILINTNVISDNELVFSDEYIKNNPKLITLFIDELCQTHKISKVSFEKNELALNLLDIINKCKTINSIYLLEDKALTYALVDKIIKPGKYEYVNCFSIPNYLLELFDKHRIRVVSRNEIFFGSRFMQENNLNQFSKLFYKISLRMTLPLTDEDMEDFDTFCHINKYLKTVHLYGINMKDLEYVVKVLEENKTSRTNILIHDNVTDPKIINYLRKENKKAKKHKIIFKLIYSDEFLEKNIINQTLVAILRVCGSIIGCLVLMIVGYIIFNNYKSLNDMGKMKDNIEEVIEKTDNTEIVEDLNKKQEDKGLTVENNYIASLLTVNPDTVGWLKIPGTNIDYPVVQGLDNDHYLKYNFYNEKDRNGWVFMDYRNEKGDLDKNTILYAHNRYSSGVMFGPLMDTLHKKWYTNPKNKYITFDTIYGTYKWEVFSLYKVNVQDYGMKIAFKDDESWEAFIKKLKKRSIYNFNVDVGKDDKIITLSTCTNNRAKRMLLHAVWHYEPKATEENTEVDNSNE